MANQSTHCTHSHSNIIFTYPVQLHILSSHAKLKLHVHEFNCILFIFSLYTYLHQLHNISFIIMLIACCVPANCPLYISCSSAYWMHGGSIACCVFTPTAHCTHPFQLNIVHVLFNCMLCIHANCPFYISYSSTYWSHVRPISCCEFTLSHILHILFIHIINTCKINYMLCIQANCTLYKSLSQKYCMYAGPISCCIFTLNHIIYILLIRILYACKINCMLCIHDHLHSTYPVYTYIEVV